MNDFNRPNYASLGLIAGLVILSFAFGARLRAEPPSESVVSTLLAQKAGFHPRLFLRAEEEAAFKRKIDASPQLSLLRSELIASAEQLLPLPPVTRIMEGRRLLSVSRTCLGRVTTLTMAWRLTNDARFRDRARSELLAAASFTDWNPSHFLDVAEMTAALAIGYDWLYPALDNETRGTLRKAIVEKGITPSFVGTHWWIKSDNNWNQVCNGGLTLGALAVAEDQPELAARVIARAVENVPRAMHGYAPDGAYPEGPGYWAYGTSYNVALIAGLESALGTDFGLAQQPGFLASSDYMLHVTGPTGLLHNYADCGGREMPSAAIYWFAARRNQPSLLWNDRLALNPGSKHVTLPENRFLPLALIWANSELKAVAPNTLDWTGGGPTPVAFFRSGWERDALFVGVKAGSPSINHAHMDVGSFVFDAQGVRWAMDFGMQSYNSLESRGINLWSMKQNSERWKIFRLSNHSHNMLVINDQLQNVAGKVAITAHGLGTDYPRAEMDCSSLFEGQAQKVGRTLSLPSRRELIVEDTIQSVATTGTVRWQMATGAEITLSETGALLRKNGKTLRVQRVTPGQGKWAVIDISAPRQDFDAPNPGAKLLVLDLPVIAGDSPRITIKLTPE